MSELSRDEENRLASDKLGRLRKAREGYGMSLHSAALFHDAADLIDMLASRLNKCEAALTGSAGTGGGGGEKVTDGTFGDIVRPEWIDVPFKTELDRPILLASAAEHLRAYAVSSERSAAWNARERASLESRLAAAEKDNADAMVMISQAQREKAAAEKRAEEAEEQCEHLRMVGAGTLVALSGGSTDGFNPVRREGMSMLEEATKIRSERDALKAELAEAKDAVDAYYRHSVKLGEERDAALARVKELEADLELSESHRSTVQGRLASIARLAEGAQP